VGWEFLTRGAVAGISVVLGTASWFAGLQIGPGPTPYPGAAWYLFIVAIAGLLVSIVEGGLSWTGLGGLYVGQLLGLGFQVFLGHPRLEGEPLGWQPLFSLSFMLAAALGGNTRCLPR
jgi:hypothetical protein